MGPLNRNKAVKMRLRGVPIGEVARHLGVSPSTVSAWTRGRLPERYDQHFLEKDTELRAYFLGLFMADGWIQGHKARLACLALNDRQIIEDVAKAIKYRNTISCIPLKKWKSKELSGKFSYRITFAGAPLKALVQLGFTSRKTGNEFIPSGISSENFGHFLRGFSDGDGSMSLVRNRDKTILSWEVTCASRKFLELLVAHLRQEKALHSRGACVYEKKERKIKRKPVFKLALGHADSVTVGQFMYSRASLKLNRKHLKWQQGSLFSVGVRRWSLGEINLARAGYLPNGRSSAAYTAIRRRIILEGI